MLQALLADRFKLAVHRETRELSVYELVVAKSGVKLKPYVEDPNPPRPDPSKLIPMDKNGNLIVRPGQVALTTSPGGQQQVVASRQTVGGSPGLVTMLGGQLGRPLLDKTGLTGFYDYTLTYRCKDRMRRLQDRWRRPTPMRRTSLPQWRSNSG